MARVHKWLKKSGVSKHKGALHRALGYSKGAHLPTSVLVAHSHGSSKTARRARFALVARGYYSGHPFKHRHAHHGRSR
jgi:hypothetical protein